MSAFLAKNTPSFWQRRVVRPILGQLQQGITPEKIALTVALGLVLGVFPILGSTMLLCALAAAVLRLNQPVIQLVNYLAYPIQIILLIPTYRAGEALFRRDPIPLSIPLLLERVQANVSMFLKDFGVLALQGIVVWCVVAPLVATIVYHLTLPALRALARRQRM